MSVSDLNIRIGVVYRDFDREMKRVENRLSQTADRFGSIGNAMSASLTLPIIGIGAAAISAAGDFESLDKALKVTMTDAGYSIGQATKELAELQRISLAPGIDMEQAVKGSLRLQAVGFSAEKARGVLVELANALASSGGSAEQLDGVTRQFAQMSAKGKVMQEDLTIILENMPSLAKVLMDTFGTTNAEAIRKMGVNAEEFINKVTEGLGKTTRVQGGIKNAINNAQVAFKQFFATIGDGINEAYNLDTVGTSINEKLQRMADAFRNLDPETKKSIFNFALFVAAVGPAVKIIQGFYGAATLAVTGIRIFGDMAKGMITSALNAAKAIGAMSTAMKFTVAGAALAGVIALAYAFNSLSDNVSSAFHVTEKLNNVTQKANEYTAESIGKVDALVAVVKSETYTQEQRTKALEELQTLYPKYFANLDKENININGVSSAYDKLRESIVKASMVRAAEEGLNEIAKTGISLQEKRSQLIESYNKSLSKTAELQAYNNAVTEKTRSGVEAEFAAKRKGFAQEIAAIDNQIASQKREFDALVNVRVANTDLSESQNTVVKSTNALAAASDTATSASSKKKKAVEDEKDAFDKYIDSVQKATEADRKRQQVAELMGISPLQQLPQAGGLTQTTTSEGVGLSGIIGSDFSGADELLKYLDVISAQVNEQLTPSLSKAELAMQSMKLSFMELSQSFKEGGEAQKMITDSVLSSIVQMTDSGSTSMEDFGRSALSSALKVAKAYAVQGIFAAVSKALSTVPFPLNLAAAGIAAGAAGALLNGLANRIQPPKLAKGGLAYGPTMAMVGDNKGASVNPEVIAPLDRLQAIMGGGSGQNIVVTGRLSGRDILLSNEKTAREMRRTR